MAEAEAARIQKESEEAARQAEAARAESEAAEAARLREQLETANSSAARARSQATAFRWILATVLAALLIVFIWWGPGWLDWRTFEVHDHRLAIQCLLSIAAVGAGYAGAGGKHRKAAIGTVIIAALLTAISLI